jgi:hypothetical protein
VSSEEGGLEVALWSASQEVSESVYPTREAVYRGGKDVDAKAMIDASDAVSRRSVAQEAVHVSNAPSGTLLVRSMTGLRGYGCREGMTVNPSDCGMELIQMQLHQ